MYVIQLQEEKRELIKALRWMLTRYAEPACMFGQATDHDETCASCNAHRALKAVQS